MRQQMEQREREHTKEVNSLRRRVKKSKELLEEEKRRSSQYVAFSAADSTRGAVGNEKITADAVEHIKVEKSVLKKVWIQTGF